MNIRRFSSRREPLDHSFLRERLRNARSYDRIAGQFGHHARRPVGPEVPRRAQADGLPVAASAHAGDGTRRPRGLNLQRLARLINLDLPWNPTRLEQRKGRIQRIGQIHDVVEIYNMRYKDSVEDRVHQLLSTRLQDIFNLLGQIPDVLGDVWVAVALGEKERARKIIDELPESHPFEIRYTNVAKINWESCREVLDAGEKNRVLSRGW